MARRHFIIHQENLDRLMDWKIRMFLFAFPKPLKGYY